MTYLPPSHTHSQQQQAWYSDHRGVPHQPKHPLDATQSNVWPTKQSESTAGTLQKCLQAAVSTDYNQSPMSTPMAKFTTWSTLTTFSLQEALVRPREFLEIHAKMLLRQTGTCKTNRTILFHGRKLETTSSLCGKQLHRRQPTKSKPTEGNSSRQSNRTG